MYSINNFWDIAEFPADGVTLLAIDVDAMSYIRLSPQTLPCVRPRAREPGRPVARPPVMCSAPHCPSSRAG